MLVSYPSLTQQELSEACLALELRCADKLGATEWVGVKYLEGDAEFRIQVIRPWEGKEEDANTDGGKNQMDCEEEKFSIMRQPPKQGLRVDYSIVLSPTYCVPVLWFSCWLFERTVKDIDELYSLLVPPESAEKVKGVGVLGGISFAHHPVSDMPSFFVHPCNTSESMLALSDGKELDPEMYLLLWIGLIGSAVGLHVPAEVIAKETS